MIRSKLSYANVTSTLALVLAIGGGTAFAATKIGSDQIRYHAVTGSKIDTNAVTPSKIRNGSVGALDVKDGSLESTDIRNGTLKAEDFGTDQLPRGEKGDPASTVWGAVSSSGALAYGKGVSGVATAAGVTTLTFGTLDVSRCAIVATVGGHAIGDAKQDAHGFASVKPGPTPQQLLVTTRPSAASDPEALPFHFAVLC